MAWHDLKSAMEGQPLWKHLGGTREKIACGLDFGIRNSLPELIAELEYAINAGYPCIKLKFGSPNGMRMLAAVRKEFPDFPFFIDCNSAYTLKDIEMFKALDKFHLMMIEQPLGADDIVDHAILQKQISTPICLDESLTSSDKARQAAQIGSGKIFNLKPGRMGGFTPSIKTLEIAKEHGISCWVGGMMESSIGRARMIALASRLEVDLPSDITPPLKKYQFDFVSDPVDYAPCPYFLQSMEKGGGRYPSPKFFDRAVVEHYHWSR
jgi:O-succinylbenzoate synthase